MGKTVICGNCGGSTHLKTFHHGARIHICDGCGWGRLEKAKAAPRRRRQKVDVDFGGGKRATFTAGGRKRYEIEEGFVAVNARLRFADGTMADGLLLIDEQSSGEHSGTGVFTGEGLAMQDDDNFLAQLGKTEADVYPYRYKVTGRLQCEDIHCGDDGWSR